MSTFPPHPFAEYPPSKRSGFALVLSLGLMALMVLLAVTLSALIQVESTSARNNLTQAIARQNALVAAYQGLGVLQKELGPDQRVSARADITGTASLKNPYWVGVWDTSAIDANGSFSGKSLTATPRRWLVSLPATGSSSITPATTFTTTGGATLVTAITTSTAITGSLANPVTAYRLTLSTSDTFGGSYAWWVSDEGMKASAALDMPDETATTAQNTLTPEELKTRRQLAKLRQGIETVSQEKVSDIAETTALSDAELLRLARMKNVGQLPMVSANASAPLFTSTRSRELAHDLTGLSYGVLASTLTVSGSRTLKQDFSTASDISGVVGPSSEGILAFVNAYKNVRTISGLATLPLTPTTPDDGNSPVVGKAYFAVSPILTELEISSSVVMGNYQKTFTPSVPNNTLNTQARMGAWFELLNPYTTAISPADGHLQVRFIDPPSYQMKFWYDANLNVNSPHWVANSPASSSTMNFYDMWKSSDGDYMGMHLLHQASTSTAPTVYEGGEPIYWFGMRAAAKWTISYASNDYTKGDELVCGYGAAKEPFEEGKTGLKLTRRYYQADGAITYKTLNSEKRPIYPIDPSSVTPAFCDNVLLHDGIITPATLNKMSEQLTAGEGYSSHSNSPYYCLWKYYTAVTLAWDNSTRPSVELWYVPDSGSLPKGDLSKAVRLSSVKLPAFESVDQSPPNGQLLDPRYRPVNDCDSKRFSIHYLRTDTSALSEGVRRTQGSWLTSTTSIDPRAPQQSDTSFDFFDNLADPNNGYTDYTKSGSDFTIITYPDPDATLTQQIDRKTGLLNNGANLDAEDVGGYILGLPGAATLSSKGGLHPAHKVPLFEIPTTVPLSLGTLQHVCLNGRRAFSIGNSWGRSAGVNNTNINLVFDKGYLSALSTSALFAIEPTEAIPNPNLLPLWSSKADAPAATQEDVLSYFLVKGAFNINSTSKNAWRAILSGGWLDEWVYTQLDGSDDSSAWTRSEASFALKKAFFRFIHTAGETFIAPDNWTGTNPMGDVQNKYYRRGVRRLSHAQIDAMAQIIVKKLKERGAPYASVAEFLSASVTSSASGPSLLEYALDPQEAADKEIFTKNGAEMPYRWSLDEMSADGARSGQTEGDIDKGSSADISQADILNTLAPTFQSRSDTFKIRAYGDVTGPDGITQASAMCELTVQRFPDPVENASLSANRITPGDKGRLFKVLSIRWLRDI